MQVDSRRILIVAHRPTDDSALLDAIAERASESPAAFTLLVPRGCSRASPRRRPGDQCCAEAEATLEGAIPVLSEAAGTPISGMIGSHDPFAAALDALNAGAYDEVIVSPRSNILSRWLRIDLPRKIASLGVRVITVNGRQERGRSAADLRAAA